MAMKVNFISACKLLKKGKHMTRSNNDFLRHVDYITLGFEDAYVPMEICLWKNGCWIRSGELWIIDYLADDWVVFKPELLKVNHNGKRKIL